MTNNLNEQLAELGRQLSEVSSQWAASLEPLVKVQEAFRRILEDNVTKQILTTIDLLKNKFTEAITPLAEGFIEFQKKLGPFLAELAGQLQELPDRNREALRILARHGWYLDPNLPIPALFQLADSFSKGSVTETNDQLCEYFDSRSGEIEASLAIQLPTRARLLHAAFQAHRRGEFALSILAFLAQADGICQEITGAQLYSRQDGVPKVASKLVLEAAEPILGSLLTPIIEPMPISASREERAVLGPVFNRHTVLHGESVDYDTRLNGCRAISLLVYVAWVLREGRSKLALSSTLEASGLSG